MLSRSLRKKHPTGCTYMGKKGQEREEGRKERAERARERMGRRETGEGKGESGFKEFVM